jgi:drug/metabolite transporter (DMT)-like permease
VFVAVMGVTVFGETMDPATIAGAAIVTAAGLFTLLWTERRRAQ